MKGLHDDDLDLLCKCYVRLAGEQISEGKVSWKVRMGNPLRYGTRQMWEDSPKVLNAHTEYQYLHYNIAKALKPEEVEYTGFGYTWPWKKDSCARYEICFEKMLQTHDTDPPRQIARFVDQVKQQPEKKKRRVASEGDYVNPLTEE